MKIYGYCGKKVNSFNLYEMKEVTFSASPDSLRRVSVFLSEMADKMDNGEFESCSHRHIENTILNWNELCPDSDIVVLEAKD